MRIFNNEQKLALLNKADQEGYDIGITGSYTMTGTVNHPRLKSGAWQLNRKNLSRTPTNLDRNNLTKSTRNLTSGYLITKAINPRVARRIIQFSIVV